MSDAEAFYDKEIAPRLLEIAEQCKGNGMSLVAVVEFEVGEVGLTLQTAGIDACGPQFRLAAHGARCFGNADKLISYLLDDDKKHADENGSRSMFLRQLARGAK